MHAELKCVACKGETMSEMEGQKRRRRRRRRAITKRIVDEHGNVKVKKFTRRKSRFQIPGLTAQRVPSLLLGLSFGFYATMAYYESKGIINDDSSGIFGFFHGFFQNLNPVLKLVLAGTVGTAIATFFGYALFTQGFKIKRWGKAFRQLVSIGVLILVISSIISPFVNEPNIVRQISDEDFQPRTETFDLSGLSSPFYDELLNSFLDLLGGLDPDIANQIVANITPTDNFGLDPTRDIYLFRWQVSETWDTATNDFKKADETTTLDFNGFDPGNEPLDPDNLRTFEIDNSYLTIGSTYSQPLVSFWNSEEGSTLTSPDNFSLKSSDPTITATKMDVFNDVNEQPIVDAKFSKSSSSGAISMPAYWKAEDKQSIGSGSVKLSELESLLGQAPSSRFPSSKLQNNGEGIKKFWGKDSLPTNYIWKDQQIGQQDAFTRKYNEFDQIFTDSTSVYAAIITIHSFIQDAVLKAYQSGSLNLDPVNGQGDFSGDTDKGHYFYEALENDLPWGLKEMLPGYVNMLRSFGIPSRVVLGFAGGTIDSNKISLQMLNIHYWIEALIPWRDDNGNLRWSWGIFNPIPIFSALQSGQIAYGRNALATSASLNVDFTSGESIPGIDFKLQTMGAKFQLNVSAGYGGVPASGQTVKLKLLDENDQNLLTQGLPSDLTNFGTDLPDAVLNDKGYALINGSVNYRGNLTIGDTNVATVKAVDIDAALNPGSGNPVNGYAILAIFGFNFNFTATGWVKNGTLVANILGLQTGTIPGVDAPGSVVVPTVSFTLSATLFDANGTDPENAIANESISLMLFTKDQFDQLDTTSTSTLDNAQNYAAGLLTDSALVTQKTDNQGNVLWVVTFPLNDNNYPVDDAIYLFLMQWKGSTVFSNPVSVLVTIRAQMDTFGYFNQSILQATQSFDTWYVNITLTSLTGILTDPLPIKGVPVDILFVNQLDFDSAGVVTYQDLVNFLSGQTEGATYYNLSIATSGHPNTRTNPLPVTDKNGTVQANILMKASEVAAGFFYYVIVVVDEFEIFTIVKNGTDTDSFKFGVAGAPGYASTQSASLSWTPQIELFMKEEKMA